MLLCLWVFLLVQVACTSGQVDDIVSSPQCISNYECDDLRACIDLACQDPCPGICHGNSSCRVHNHVAYCSCKPGQTGDPFSGCQKQKAPECPSSSALRGRKRFSVERFVKVNFYTAFVHCMTHGGRLASVESKEDNDRIKEAIQLANLSPTDQFWTSGTNYAMGQWVWMSSGQSLGSFTAWREGEPNNVNDNEHCLEFGFWLTEQKWNDRNCLNENYPICEYFY